jgi:hypothetical protein
MLQTLWPDLSAGDKYSMPVRKPSFKPFTVFASDDIEKIDCMMMALFD